MKRWSFNTFAIAGFAGSAVAVILLIVNALSGSQFLSVLLPLAVVALVVGGFMSVRAHLLWMRGRNKPFG
ncbi:hypothetical protein [Glaciibacter sp. 2TAF33]|uniref:hypothetical protein n=1 Tax=Glaciibacter sp. 2TAF33 TaxID=3233015 RepID=UPI003F910EB6